MRAYESVYETIEDNEDASNIQYIKLYNVGQKVVTRNCKGYLPSQVAFYLQNIHISPRKVSECRCGRVQVTCVTSNCHVRMLSYEACSSGVTLCSHCIAHMDACAAFAVRHLHTRHNAYLSSIVQIWLTRHAESVSQLIGEIGEDTGELTEAGRLYSMTLAKFIKLEQEVCDSFAPL